MGDDRGRGQVVDVVGEHEEILAVDVDGDQAVRQIVEPAAERLATGAQSRPQVVLHPVGGRWAVGADVRLDGPTARVVDARQPGPALDPVQALHGSLTVARRPEAQVALPHQRLQQGVGLAAQARCRRTERPQRPTATASSSRVSGPSTTASRTASRNAGQSPGASP